MDTGLQEVDQDIQALEEQKAELLRQLSLVQQQICTAQAKRVGSSSRRANMQYNASLTQYTEVLAAAADVSNRFWVYQ